jgi:leucine dehydrogenase
LPIDLGGTGDPSQATAYGVFVGMQAASNHVGWTDGLDGKTVAVQGLGNVGMHLCRYLSSAGARLIVADLNRNAVDRAVSEFEATSVEPDRIYDVEADVFAPCALGGTINDRTLPLLHAKIVAGSANNTLAAEGHGADLRARGIVYAPDYVINSGGLIKVAEAKLGHDAEATERRVHEIYEITRQILERADHQNVATNVAADRVAEERFTRHHPRLAA